MEKAPDGDGDAGGGGEGPEPLTYKTWILRVPIHCGGCQKKVKKVLQSIEGVYKIEIDSKQHRVVVTCNVESGTLIKKLTKSGKTAELWTEKQSKNGEASAGDGGENKVDQTDGQKTGCDSSGEDQAEEKGGGQPPAAQGGAKKKKKKKKKKGSNANAGGAPAPGAGGAPASGAGGAPATGGHVEQTNVNSPRQQVFSYPQFYYPAPEYGMSYACNSAPQTASMGRGYYTMPRYSYAYYGAETYLPSDSIIDTTTINHDDTPCSIT
ncbi:heavy metal-associated isoprenylated plant protein 36-like [Salvia divinorum]|uniref:Heavy metal-associated isoprenylated plant protein 36-like n=1 Tax=Salvia divinorum TaxID=28513 RepID=A0ABD1GF73_SALDI